MPFSNHLQHCHHKMFSRYFLSNGQRGSYLFKNQFRHLSNTNFINKRITTSMNNKPLILHQKQNRYMMHNIASKNNNILKLNSNISKTMKTTMVSQNLSSLININKNMNRLHSTTTPASLPNNNNNNNNNDESNNTEFRPRQTGRPIYDPMDEHNTNHPFDYALPHRTTIVFSMKDIPGSLERILNIFGTNNINLTRIESRYGASHSIVNFFIDVDLPPNHRRIKKLLKQLREPILKDIIVTADIMGSRQVPWFPITMSEVDSLALLVLEGGSDLEADHPGFNDKEYRKRRQDIADYASKFKFGDKPQIIEYTSNEIDAWSKLWTKLNPLLYKHACPQYLDAFEKLQKHCGYNIENIPQLADVSEFLYDNTGFRLRPTAGLISSRHFLNGLAFRVFFCTQYLRHWSVPFYTPEPDVVHELVGHAPLFANPEFADFSQEIGLASIGATDEQIVQLARCYWFSVEFGLCRSSPGSNDRKIYGAGILSSFGETEYSMSDKPEIRDWDPFQAAFQDYPITKYQPIYYIADSFEDAKEKLVEYAESFDRPFSVKWDDVKEKLIVDRNIKRGPRNYKDFGEYVGNTDDSTNDTVEFSDSDTENNSK